jgi:hypothetical protein
MRQNTTRLYASFISLCFGLYLGLMVSGPHISPYKVYLGHISPLGFILVWSQYK